MSGTNSSYYALNAKVKALYGMRLKSADFHRIAALSDLRAVLDYLRTQTGWRSALESLDDSTLFYSTGELSRIRLEAALMDQARAEYLRLLHFVPRADRALTRFPTLLADLQAIMTALRRLRAGHAKEALPLPPDFASRSRIDHAALFRCADYDELAAAVKGSLYYKPLLHLRPEQPGTFPDYTAAEALLKSAYYGRMYRIIRKHYEGETRDVLLKSFGLEVDMLNLLHILRLKQFFPDEHEYYSVLFPYHYRLKPAMTAALCAAPDLAAAVRLLGETPYGPFFRGMTLRQMEVEYRRRLYQFNQHQLVTGRPSVYTAVAYLNLKDLERKALINVIESVHYGIAFDSTLIDQIGD